MGMHTAIYTLTNTTKNSRVELASPKKSKISCLKKKILLKHIILNCCLCKCVCFCVCVCCDGLLTWCPVTSEHLWFLTPGSLQRDFWSPEPSPVSRGTVAAGVSASGTAERPTLRKTVSVDDRLLQPDSDEGPHLRLLSRLKRGRKKLHNIQVGFYILLTSMSPAMRCWVQLNLSCFVYSTHLDFFSCFFVPWINIFWCVFTQKCEK